MEKIKATFIATVYNEEEHIAKFLDSLLGQSRLPDEIVIVDAGSTDRTKEIIEKKKKLFSKLAGTFTLISKTGNRSVGRNTAIREAHGEIITCSDAGCSLDKDWLENILEPFKKANIDVVSGYYHPLTQTLFQKCLAAYTCVMPDKIDTENYLPSSRSIAFKKSAWELVCGYPEHLNTCEDLVFARKLKNRDLNFVFTEDAFVYWPQRKNLSAAAAQFFTYAVGDGAARYFRPQTPLLFIRYIFGILLLFTIVYLKFYTGIVALFCLIIFYSIWSIMKNYHYVQNWHAFYILPLLQFTADLAVLCGMSIGLLKSIRLKFGLIIRMQS